MGWEIGSRVGNQVLLLFRLRDKQSAESFCVCKSGGNQPRHRKLILVHTLQAKVEREKFAASKTVTRQTNSLSCECVLGNCRLAANFNTQDSLSHVVLLRRCADEREKDLVYVLCACRAAVCVLRA